MESLLYADLTYKIRKAIFNVYNHLGYGHKERVYQNALIKELSEINIPFQQEVTLNVFYKNEKVGYYRADIIVDEKIILEIKAVEFIPETYEVQLLHYLKSTKFRLGLLINFGSPKVYIKRLIWTPNHLL